jgi:putative membrane protein
MNYWMDLAATWSWLLWIGMIVLLFSTTGNWGYTYQAHQKFGDLPNGEVALGILAQRYAKGEIKEEEFHRVKNEILTLLDHKSRTNSDKRRERSASSLATPLVNT